MSNLLFDRQFTLRVGTLDVSNLDCAFKICRNIKPEPHKCEFHIWNLTEEHRKQITSGRTNPNPKKNVPIHVELEAGYKDNTSLIFSGDLTISQSRRDGADIITDVQGSDSANSAKFARINQSYGPGTRVGRVLRDCAAAMRVGEGNLRDFESVVSIPNIGTAYPDAHALSGSAFHEFDNLIKSAGLEWSIQHGSLQIKARGQALTTTALLLTPETGLIGSPKSANTPADPTKKTKTEAVIECETLMVPGAFPGRLAQLKTETYSGTYQMTEVETVGEFSGATWGHKLKLRPV